MSSKQDFTPSEWEEILEGPPSAGMLVITAQRGGMWRETISMAKAYTEARQQHGKSELLDEIVAAEPKVDHTRYHSQQELQEHSTGHLRDAVAALTGKATPEELAEYKRFVLNLAERVAAAHQSTAKRRERSARPSAKRSTRSRKPSGSCRGAGPLLRRPRSGGAGMIGSSRWLASSRAPVWIVVVPSKTLRRAGRRGGCAGTRPSRGTRAARLAG